MADDPRIDAATERLLAGNFAPSEYRAPALAREWAQRAAATALAAAEAADPLRALLADTQQARVFLAEHLAGRDRWAALTAEDRQTWIETRLYRIDPLLAALREVAGL